jgi:acetylornithine deacetylase
MISPATDVVDLAARMMEIDSTSGREGGLVDWLEGALLGAEWRVQRIAVSPGRDDLLATWTEESLVTLSTHLDTVPPFLPPRLDGEYLCGRGACDAKGIAAAMIVAAQRLRDRGIPACLLFVVGEEVSHDGAIAANSFPNHSRVLVNGEPTESTLAVGTKGAMRMVLRTRGQAAHSAYPHLGASAISLLARLLVELESVTLPSDPELGDTTINVGSVSGGVADNVVAPWAEARLMARLVGEPQALLETLQRWLRGRAELDPGITVLPVRLGSLPGFATSVAAFATDIPELSSWGRPFLFGPGSITVAHRDDERIAVAELRDAAAAYVRIAEAALAATRG